MIKSQKAKRGDNRIGGDEACRCDCGNTRVPAPFPLLRLCERRGEEEEERLGQSEFQGSNERDRSANRKQLKASGSRGCLGSREGGNG